MGRLTHPQLLMVFTLGKRETQFFFSSFIVAPHSSFSCGNNFHAVFTAAALYFAVSKCAQVQCSAASSLLLSATSFFSLSPPHGPLFVKAADFFAAAKKELFE